MSRNGPTPMQWRCLVMLDRHDGNVKAAAHAVGITPWTCWYHLRALCASQGFPNVHRALMFYAPELARKNGQARCHRPCKVSPGQECLGLVA